VKHPPPKPLREEKQIDHDRAYEIKVKKCTKAKRLLKNVGSLKNAFLFHEIFQRNYGE